MSENITIGKRGEDIACDFLSKKGFEILRRNYTFRRCEIDIIAQRGDWLLFIEVKTRTRDQFGHPEEFVDAAQAGRIMQAAEEFIYATNWRGHIRFDIISVKPEPHLEVIHFEDAIN